MGYQSFNPFKTSWHVLEGPQGSLTNLTTSNHSLESTGKSLSFWQGMAKLSKDFRWAVVFFRVRFSARLPGQFVPAQINVTFSPLAGLAVPAQVVWDPWVKKRKRQQRGWDIDLEGLDEEPLAIEDLQEEFPELDGEAASDADANSEEEACICVGLVPSAALCVPLACAQHVLLGCLV